MKVVRLSPEAIDELVEAAACYRARRPGLESELVDEVERLLPLIESSPASFPRILDVPADLVVRRALLPRVPYALILRVTFSTPTVRHRLKRLSLGVDVTVTRRRVN